MTLNLIADCSTLFLNEAGHVTEFVHRIPNIILIKKCILSKPKLAVL